MCDSIIINSKQNRSGMSGDFSFLLQFKHIEQLYVIFDLIFLHNLWAFFYKSLKKKKKIIKQNNKIDFNLR